MNKLKIIIAPDKRLEQKSLILKNKDSNSLKFIDKMFEAMYENNGIGLAAPQVGELIRIVVMDCTNADTKKKPIAFINPEIIATSKEMVEYDEGCLSLPGYFGKIYRPASVKVRYIDKLGESRIKNFTGLEATCIQHEVDHLNGILFVDYLSKLRKQIIFRKLKKYKKANNL